MTNNILARFQAIDFLHPIRVTLNEEHNKLCDNPLTYYFQYSRIEALDEILNRIDEMEDDLTNLFEEALNRSEDKNET